MRKLQRPLYEIIGFAMAVLFALPFGVFFEQIFGFALWRTAFLPVFGVLGYLTGRATLRADVEPAMIGCGIAAVASAVLTAIFLPSHGLAGIFLIFLSLLLSVFLFFMARRAGYSLYTPMSTVGILCDLVILAISSQAGVSDESAQLLSVSACAFFLLSLYAFNVNSLRNSLLKGVGSRNIRYPRGMKLSNFWLLTGFILIAILVSNIYPLFQGFSGLFVTVVMGIAKALGLVSGFFDKRITVNGTDEESSSSSEVSDEDNIFKYESKEEAPIITTLVEIFAMIIVAIILCFALYKLIVYLRAKLKGKKFMGKLRGMFATPVQDDYVEETENLMDWKDFWRSARDNIRQGAKKLTQRPQRFDDFKDNRLKIRFVYQQLLKNRINTAPACVCQTPNELADELGSDTDLNGFISAYNGVKYADKAPDAAEVETARRVLKRKF